MPNVCRGAELASEAPISLSTSFMMAWLSCKPSLLVSD